MGDRTTQDSNCSLSSLLKMVQTEHLDQFFFICEICNQELEYRELSQHAQEHKSEIPKRDSPSNPIWVSTLSNSDDDFVEIPVNPCTEKSVQVPPEDSPHSVNSTSVYTSESSEKSFKASRSYDDLYQNQTTIKPILSSVFSVQTEKPSSYKRSANKFGPYSSQVSNMKLTNVTENNLTSLRNRSSNYNNYNQSHAFRLPCEFCQDVFSSPLELMVHQESFHRIKSSSMNWCMSCGRKFSSTRTLHQHEISFHPYKNFQ